MLLFWQIEALLKRYKLDLDTPVNKFPDKLIHEIMNGTEQALVLTNTPLGNSSGYSIRFDGLLSLLESRAKEETNVKEKNKWSKQFVNKETCPDCHGDRLKKESLQFKIHDKNIAELASMDINELLDFFQNIESHLNHKQNEIAREILKEIRTRLQLSLT